MQGKRGGCAEPLGTRKRASCVAGAASIFRAMSSRSVCAGARGAGIFESFVDFAAGGGELLFLEEQLGQMVVILHAVERIEQ